MGAASTSAGRRLSSPGAGRALIWRASCPWPAAWSRAVAFGGLGRCAVAAWIRSMRAGHEPDHVGHRRRSIERIRSGSNHMPRNWLPSALPLSGGEEGVDLGQLALVEAARQRRGRCRRACGARSPPKSARIRLPPRARVSRARSSKWGSLAFSRLAQGQRRSQHRLAGFIPASRLRASPSPDRTGRPSSSATDLPPGCRAAAARARSNAPSAAAPDRARAAAGTWCRTSPASPPGRARQSRLGAGVVMTVLGTDGGAVGVAVATSAPSITASMNVPP